MANAGLPERLLTSFAQLGLKDAGAASYLQLATGCSNPALPNVPDQQYGILVSGDKASPDFGSLVISGQGAAPNPATRPLVIKPDGSVNVQSLTVAGQPYVPGGGGGGAGVSTISDGLNTASGAVAIVGSQGIVTSVSGQTLTIVGPQAVSSIACDGSAALSGAVKLVGSGSISVEAKGGQEITFSSVAPAPLTGVAVVGPGAAQYVAILDFSGQPAGAFIVTQTTTIGTGTDPLFQISYQIGWDGTALYASSMDGNIVAYNVGDVVGYTTGVNAAAKSQLLVAQDAAPGAGIATTTSVKAYRVA